jgi:signal peptidase
MDNLAVSSFIPFMSFTSFTSFISLIGYNSYTYYLKPAIWLLAAIIALKYPRMRHAAKIRFRDGIILWAFCFAASHILLSIGAAFIDGGFGKSPYDHSLKGMLNNILLVGLTIAGREIIRAYVINTMAGQKVRYLLFLIVSLVYTFCNYTLLSYVRLKSFKDIVVFCAEFFIPEFSQNLMTTYLAYLGGFAPAVTYTGVLQVFHWFSPVLPNLKWITAALVGILCPVFSMILM